MNALDAAYSINDQLPGQWDFEIVPGKDTPSSYETIKYKVQNVSIPTYKLECERKINGELMYVAMNDLTEVSVTLREENIGSTFYFIHAWLEKFYDFNKRCFKKKTSAEQDCYDCILHFYNGQTIENYPNSSYTKQPYLNDNYTKEVSSIVFKNCKPIACEPFDVSYSSTDPVMFTLTFLPERIESKNKTFGNILATK